MASASIIAHGAWGEQSDIGEPTAASLPKRRIQTRLALSSLGWCVMLLHKISVVRVHPVYDESLRFEKWGSGPVNGIEEMSRRAHMLMKAPSSSRPFWFKGAHKAGKERPTDGLILAKLSRTRKRRQWRVREVESR